MSTPLHRYAIITGTLGEVESLVDRYLEDGWEISGSLLILDADPDNTLFVQTVARQLLARKL